MAAISTRGIPKQTWGPGNGRGPEVRGVARVEFNVPIPVPAIDTKGIARAEFNAIFPMPVLSTAASGRAEMEVRALTVSDSFDRTNSVTVPGSTDNGYGGSMGATAWTVLSGNWGITSNLAYPSTIVAGDAQMVIDIGGTNHAASIILGNTGVDVGVICRVQDASNYYLYQSESGACRLYKKVAGTYTQIGTATGSAGTGDQITLECIGTAIKTYVNGVLKHNVTDATLTTGTKVGLRGGNIGNRYNAFAANLLP